LQITEKSGAHFFVYAPDYDVERTFECGQCFRFEKNSESEYECEYHGVAHGRYMRFASDSDGNLHIIGAPACESSLWLHYLGLDRDYGEIKKQILIDFGNHTFVKEAIEKTGGLRILAQERFETLCSFILSQNNNIPRIKKLVEGLCEKYGAEIETPLGIRYSFPDAHALAKAELTDLEGMKMGYRARYIQNAARAVASGEFDLDGVTPDNAEERLMSLLGVGRKVASCIRLFAIEDYASFPVDVWVKRIIETRFGGVLDLSKTGAYGGVVQQYLFCYERELANK